MVKEALYMCTFYIVPRLYINIYALKSLKRIFALNLYFNIYLEVWSSIKVGRIPLRPQSKNWLESHLSLSLWHKE